MNDERFLHILWILIFVYLSVQLFQEIELFTSGIEGFVAHNVPDRVLPKSTIKTSLDLDFERVNHYFKRLERPETPLPEDLTPVTFSENGAKSIMTHLLNQINKQYPDQVDLNFVVYKSAIRKVSDRNALWEIDAHFYDKKRHMGYYGKFRILHLPDLKNNRDNNAKEIAEEEDRVILIKAQLENYPKWSGTPGVDSIGMRSDKYEILNPLRLMDPYLTSGVDYIVTKEMVDQYIKDRLKNRKTSNDYLCFDTTNVLASTKSECERSGGTWDRPVRDSLNCPYYLANKNYPNARGGVNRGGRCELPANMQLIGYRHFDDSLLYKPLCYNCLKGLDGAKNSIGMCCDEQRDKPELYPNLISPDYMFPGDLIDRERHKKILAKRGLLSGRFDARKKEDIYKKIDKIEKELNNL